MRPLPQRYAQALFELSPDAPAFFAACDRLSADSALWQALTHPGIAADEKRRVLLQVLEDSGAVLQNFFSLLCDRGRMALLPEIRQAYRALQLESENAMEALLCCVQAPSATDLERLEQGLCRIHGKSRAEIALRQEPELIGGFVLTAGGTTYDRSIKGALHSLRRTLKAR